MGTPRNFSNTASGASLSADLSAGATSATLTNYSNFPAAPFTATIGRNQPDEEIVLVTAVAGSTVTITRGFDGTAAQAHISGAAFEHTAVAKDYRDASAHVESTGAVHGLTGNIVGDSDAQTLTNKIVKYLKGLATNAAAAFEADNDAGQTGKLFRGLSAGVEKFFVDYLGNLTAQAVTATTGAFSGAVTALSVTVTNGISAASASLTGALTAGGLLSANGGITVPTGKKVTLTDAPATGTDAANKSYVDGRTVTSASISDATSAATANTVVKRDSTGRAQFLDPNAAADAATKSYVDSALTGYPRGPVPSGYGKTSTVFSAPNDGSTVSVTELPPAPLMLSAGRLYRATLAGRVSSGTAGTNVAWTLRGALGSSVAATSQSVVAIRTVHASAGGGGQQDVSSSGYFQVSASGSYTIGNFLSGTSGSVASLVQDARGRYDWIIEDAGPVSAISTNGPISL